MGLILCENRPAEHPLYIPEMGRRVFSLEELCYVIYNYPLIAMDGFVNDGLMQFLRNDIGIGLHAVNLEKSLSEWANYDEVLVSILGLADYYSQQEIDDYRVKISDIRKKSRYEFYRMKGDLLFTLEQYGKAISYYERSLFDSKDQKADENYFYRVYKSMGAAYANLYRLDEAFEAYTKAYTYKNEDGILRQIYFLSRLQDNIDSKQRYLESIGERAAPEWDLEFEELMQASENDEAVKEIDSLSNLDSVKRHRHITGIINRWKRNYRNML